ncbi:MAG: hypothetical protein JXB13_06585 [Phycisphaerae bacterium]|nr:hypothetical protein [Phycisphaerae bacterium]
MVVICDELQEVADLMCASAPRAPLLVKIKNTRRGYAHGRTGWVSVPVWATEERLEYAWYYVIHEVCHVLSGEHRHTAKFQALERRWLAAFGLVPVYRGVYPGELQSTTGRTLWSELRSKHLRPRVPRIGSYRRRAAGQNERS